MADAQSLTFNFDSKKKKKPTKAAEAAEAAASPATETPAVEAVAPAAESSPAPVPALGFNPNEKKRSTKKTDAASTAATPAPEGSESAAQEAPKEGSTEEEPKPSGSENVPPTNIPSAVSGVGEDEQDYAYKEILDRFYSLVVHGPEGSSSIKLPQVAREGSKKTVWVNFQDICTSMNRSIEHVTSFVLAELGTDGNMDGSSRLVIKGKYMPRQIESILRRYISEYVTCQMCKSRNTELTRHQTTRLYFLKCNSCQSSRSVAVIKTGFKAQVGKRKKEQ
eukprot:TRINITY_DN2217_c0_g1_i1.p1 TRINITY_DN2217_c0_g1~~TRINITY_DN2217_c0_g1_i1.p1  ORF type:complete len:279 (-),score=69.09 TRINITY_DN2217_c0_g1_i1:187-1023(-)